MLSFDKCPVCGGEMVEKPVEKLLRGGGRSMTVLVLAEVCLRCGEKLYSAKSVRQFEQVRKTLREVERSI